MVYFVEHGFTKDNKDHNIDIRVIHKDGDIILRIKDNCKAFDPLERASIPDSEEKIGNVGIRMIRDIAKDMQYKNLLGLNVLTIRI